MSFPGRVFAILEAMILAAYFRNFIFGVEDSLVSTVGLLSGVAVTGAPREVIFVIGFILILVEAVSMAAGSFLSEYSAESYVSRAERPTKSNFISAAIMFGSYFVSGFIPLAPYLFFRVDWALGLSVFFSVTALFMLGMAGAKAARINVWRNGLRMSLVGGAAIAVGIMAGKFLSGMH